MISSLGLVKIKEADDIEEKLNEVERLLKNAINMPCKVGAAWQLMSVRRCWRLRFYGREQMFAY